MNDISNALVLFRAEFIERLRALDHGPAVEVGGYVALPRTFLACPPAAILWQVKYDELSVVLQQRKQERQISNFVHQLSDGLLGALGFGGELIDLHVLRGVRGTLRPGTTTIILGAPGSGERRAVCAPIY